MSLYVFDTDVLTLLQHHHAQTMRSCLAHLTDDMAVTVVSVEEQLTGWYTKLRRTKKLEQISPVYDLLAENVRYLALFRILAFPNEAVEKYRELQALKTGV